MTINMFNLTPKQSRFIDEYLVDLNATQAALRAGYSRNTASEIGYENLNKPQLASEIRQRMESRQETTAINAETVQAGLLEIATDDTATASARVQAWTQLGRSVGMFTDRVAYSGDLREHAIQRARELGISDEEALEIVKDVERRAKTGEL